MQLSDNDFLRGLVQKHGKEKNALIPLLIAIQRQYQFLPEPTLKFLVETTRITPGDIRGVSTFYPWFKFELSAKHSIRVCTGTACHIKRAEQVYEGFRKALRIPEGKHNDEQKQFSVGRVSCLGCCSMAPAVQIDQMVYGWVDPGQTRQLTQDFLENQHHKYPAFSLITKKKQVGEIKICLCSVCLASGAQKTYHAVRQLTGRLNLSVRPLEVGCIGMSFRSPLVQVTNFQGQVFYYGNVEEDGVSDILLHHFKPHSLLRWFEKILIPGSDLLSKHKIDIESAEYKKWLTAQTRIVSTDSGQTHPGNLSSYEKIGGLQGIELALKQDSDQIINKIIHSQLRGRGGAGFPTGKKWQTTKNAIANTKIVICNGDEGDPGAFMDRMLLESFPFRVIEGILIAAYAVGANQGYIYIREEYPLAVKRIREAISTCQDNGVLGKQVLGQDFQFNLQLVEGAGAFVCGEETALIASLEGRRAIPRLRPPYPAEKGLNQWPTLINNVETFANIPWIMTHGAEKFKSYGTVGSKGTKIFALAGKTNRGGLIEVPMGTGLRTIVDDMGGGVTGGRKLKAVLMGGPSGGCIPEHLLDIPVDYEQLESIGTIMGSGGLVVLDEHDCMVDIAGYFLGFTADESCGKCTACRIGSQRMLEIINRLCMGKGKKNDIEQLETLSKLMQQSSQCGLGRTAPNPVVSTLKYFRNEYLDHLDKHCPAGKCAQLFKFSINQKCTGCTLCYRACSNQAIAFAPWERPEIDHDKCTRCGMCRLACSESAIEVSR